MKKVFCFLFVIFSLNSPAQEKSSEDPTFLLFLDSLQKQCKSLFTSKTDAEKYKYNQQLLATFEHALNTPNSFDFPFDSLTDIAVLMSPDKKFRILNWNVPNNDGTHEYFGFIQEKHSVVKKKGLFRKELTETMQLYPLIDKSAEIKNPENVITDNKKWFGMLYYKIIQTHTKSKTYYTLLAWDGNDKFSSKKIIDVLTFDDKGTPRFGAAIFSVQKKYPKRVIFEYSSTCTMSLRYSVDKDSIIFDHLAPTQPQLEGQFQYYCSDMSYDGFGFKHGKWNYGTDLNAINEKDYKDKIYNDPHNKRKSKESNNYNSIMDESTPTGNGNKVIKQDKKPKKRKN